MHQSLTLKKQENNRMGKTRDLFMKIRDIKQIFHAKMGTVKDRNSKDLTDAEEIKMQKRLKHGRTVFAFVFVLKS